MDARPGTTEGKMLGDGDTEDSNLSAVCSSASPDQSFTFLPPPITAGGVSSSSGVSSQPRVSVPCVRNTNNQPSMDVSSSTASPTKDMKMELNCEMDTDENVMEPLAVISNAHGPVVVLGSSDQLLMTSPKDKVMQEAASSVSMSAMPSPAANIAAADSNSPKQTFIPCRVCGDKASGYHYGVTSCEGCKGFFRRSIQKQIEYRCLRDGKCLVMRLNRNRCQYCRFKKCLAVGMSRDSVRYGRMPRRSKSMDEQRVTTSDSGSGDQQQDQAIVESRQLAIYDIILTISHAHHANCTVTEDKIKQLVKKPASLLEKIEASVNVITTDLLDAHRCQMFQNIAAMVTPCINSVVEFAKRVPGFSELTQDDQLVLIKAGFFEIWLTRMSKMFDETSKKVTFGDGSVIPQDELDIIYSPDLVHTMYLYAESFSQLQLNDTEVGLFTGVVLATPDRPGLCNITVVTKVQDKLIEALKLQISRNHSTEPNLFPNILMKIPELRAVGAKYSEQVNWFRERWSKMRLPPLFSEIFDIPKTEEDVVQQPPAVEVVD